MSHVTGSVQAVSPTIMIGPDSGTAPTTPPDTWTLNFAHAVATGGTKLLILHFRNASLPANNRLEVDLGYDTDVFTSADGSEFWTRPININVLAGGLVPIRYIRNGAATGSVVLDKYGRGERHDEDPELSTNPLFDSFSNCDPFLPSATYTEPDYAKFWFCAATPNWENINCVPGAGDVRKQVAPSVGMVIAVHGVHVSTCSVTLIGPDRVITAGHCVADPAEEIFTASVTFDYAVNCDGTKPAGYNARFHKVTGLVKFRNKTIGTDYYDYCVLILKVPPAGLGLTPIVMRNSLPGVGEQVFGIHHPNGAVKKVSIPHPGFATVASSGAGSIGVNLDVSGGSSGSGLFDSSGRIVGVLSNGAACGLSYFPTATILTDLAAPAPPITRDVMIVFDRSGSMSLDAGTGRTKIQEARDAASLFVQLVRVATGNRIGLASFSTTATMPVDFAMANATPANKASLVGPAPFTGGVVGGLMPGGATSIGGGLDAARMQFPVPGANPRAILLLTDGLQNTPPMIATVEPSLAGIDINVIGYGTEASLDGNLLNNLARQHNGLYTRAMSPLHLKKFFGLAFGNIFEAGALIDPEFVLREGEDTAPRFPFRVCGEETITVVIGWDRANADLRGRLISPAGAVIGGTTVETASGVTWSFLRVSLPQNGERDGQWSVEVFRAGTGGEFPAPRVQVTYFIQVIANGGPKLEPMPSGRKYYTGDVINPRVALKYSDGTFPQKAKVQVTVNRPDAGIGNILTRSRLRSSATVDLDAIPPRQATLLALEVESGKPSVGYTQETFDLFDDGAHGDGTFEKDGVFGDWLKELLTVDGDYAFHFKAVYGDICTATRELSWSLHVEPGIDPSRTDIRISGIATHADGSRGLSITFVPRDRYGNHVGPGRPDAFTITGGTGTTITGAAQDNGDGSYTVTGVFDPSLGNSPGVVITQPGRPPVIVQEPVPTCAIWKFSVWGLLILVLILILMLLLVIQ